MSDRTDLPPPATSPIQELEGLLRLLDALDFLTTTSSSPSGSFQVPSTFSGDYFAPPPTIGRQPPHSIHSRDSLPPAPQVSVYDLSAIPPQNRGLEVIFVIAPHLSGGSTPGLARSNALRRRESTRLRRSASRRDLRREPWTLDGLGIGRMGFHNRAGLGPKSQGRLHDRVADILDAGKADAEDGRGTEPVVWMRHWDSGRG